MYDGRDELSIIQEDIKRALPKPKKKWGMLIDLRRCVLCHACTAGCVAEQKSPPGINYRPVYEEEIGVFPAVKRRFTPRPCLQCDNPPCVPVCPKKGEKGATWKSSKGLSAGIVMINYQECIGCGRCVVACPYKARNLDLGEFYTEGTPKTQAYEAEPSWEYSRKWPREKGQVPIGVARKCHFCYHRLKAGMVPMCVSTCIARANYFGDLDDPQSLIYKTMKANKISVLQSVKSNGAGKVSLAQMKDLSLEELGGKIGYPGKTPVFGSTAPTKPRVFYIVP